MAELSPPREKNKMVRLSHLMLLSSWGQLFRKVVEVNYNNYSLASGFLLPSS